MTPEREKLIRDHWRRYRDRWHETIGHEFKVVVDVPEFVPSFPLKPMENEHKLEILTFTRERRPLGGYLVECEGLVMIGVYI